MGFQYTGQFNAYTARATGQVIANARDPKKYKINKYTQLVKTDDELFQYYLVHPDDFVRSVRPQSKVWIDGQKRPEISGQRARHRTESGQAIRYDEDFQIGWRTLKKADYNVLLANTKSAENATMLEWTRETIALVEDAANWASNHAQAADMAGGGAWDAGTPEDPVIKKTLLEIAENICLNTNGMVGDFENEEDVGLILLLGVEAARRMATSPEIHAIFKESLFTDKLIRNSAANPNAIFGLPLNLYGYSVIVETAVIVTERAQADGDLASIEGDPAPRRFLKDFSSAVVLSRPGKVDGEIGAPNYSTVQRYYVDSEMKLQIFDDAKHEYTDGHVVRFGTTKLAAPATGFLVENILAAA